MDYDLLKRLFSSFFPPSISDVEPTIGLIVVFFALVPRASRTLLPSEI